MGAAALAAVALHSLWDASANVGRTLVFAVLHWTDRVASTECWVKFPKPPVVMVPPMLHERFMM